MNAKVNEVRIRKWMEILQAASTSELSKTEWCRQNGITKRTFYYWQHKVREYLLEQGAAGDIAFPVSVVQSAESERPVFCEIHEKDPFPNAGSIETDFRADAVIRCGRLSIMINEDTSVSTLSRLFATLKSGL